MAYQRRKTDSTHAAIGKALRDVTIVTDVHELGRIGADFIARHVVTKTPVFIEAKSHKKVSHRSEKQLTKNEATMAVVYPEHWKRCETVDEALAAVGVGRPAPVFDNTDLTNVAFRPADLSPLARKPCPRWCGWEHPGHVNDPHPLPGQSFFLVKGEDDVQRARCANETHDFNPRPLPKPLSTLARRLKRRGAP